VHEADRVLAPKRAKDEDQQELDLPRKGNAGTTPAEELEAYVENPEPMTTLVFVSGRSMPIGASSSCFASMPMPSIAARLASPREAAIWIQKRLEKDELTIEPKALSLLLETTGLSLGRIPAPRIENAGAVCGGGIGNHAQHVRESGDSTERIRGCVSR
jgi:hypothetical protein